MNTSETVPLPKKRALNSTNESLVRLYDGNSGGPGPEIIRQRHGEGSQTVEVIKTAIIEDEGLARQRIRRMLSRATGFAVTAEFEDSEKGLAYLSESQVDLLFLDIEMPGLDGFALLSALPEARRPAVVFVTAHSHYAVRAFEAHAFDYLLKPFDQARLEKTLERARREIGSWRNYEQLNELLSELRQRDPAPRRITIRASGRLFFVGEEEIDWIEAADNYVSLHTGKETHLMRETMNALERRLDSRRFLRIHRSAMVNADRIQEVRPWFHGEYIVVLKTGRELTLSRSYRDRILAQLGA